MTCPGCGQRATPNTFPSISSDPRPDDPWWCRSCLAARILAAHDDHCRCVGCRPTPGRSNAA